MGRSDRHEIASRLLVLVVHLMKLRYQPEKQKGGWFATIRVQRKTIRRRLSRRPSLAAKLADELAAAYADARSDAADETGLPLSAFPDLCPFTLDEILDDRFIG